MLEAREIWGTAPPEPRSRLSNWPTVLFSWWCTSFAAVIIITRVLGRKVRSDTLFREDWIMLLSIIPMFIRMIFIHFVLIYGTNNIDTTDHTFTELQLEHHSIGARLVLVARIFYAMTIWLNKLCVSDFLKRITIRVWRRSWELTLQGIRIFLFVTFGAVVIATLTECQPFDHYWQVIPDPGSHCRQGFAQLIAMGTCDIITDILLIAFPIPVVLMSGQSWKRKLQMGSLFSLSIIMIGVTATRMPMVIMHQGRQQYRTVWASCEILASAGVSNAVILGSFLRDKGTKRNKFRSYSITGSLERPSTRRPTIATIHPSGSDEDLYRSLGCRIPDHLQDKSPSAPRLAPLATPAMQYNRENSQHLDLSPTQTRRMERPSSSDDSMTRPVLHQSLPSPAPSTTRSASFFDVGNLLEDNERSVGSSTLVDYGSPDVAAQDFATAASRLQPSRSTPHAFMRDLGGMLSEVRPPHFVRRGSRETRPSGRQQQLTGRNPDGTRTAPMGVLGPMLERHETEASLQDAGGLLETSSSPTSGAWGMGGSRPMPNGEGAQARTTGGAEFRHDIELDDIGGLLDGEDRRLDRAAMSLQDMLRRDRVPLADAPLRSRQAADASDGMVLHDPGGLAGGGA